MEAWQFYFSFNKDTKPLTGLSRATVNAKVFARGFIVPTVGETIKAFRIKPTKKIKQNIV